MVRATLAKAGLTVVVGAGLVAVAVAAAAAVAEAVAVAAAAAAGGGWGNGRVMRILSAHRKAGGGRPQEALAVGQGWGRRAGASLGPEEELL